MTDGPSTWLAVVRPDDLLVLTFGLINLTVQNGQLVRLDPGAPATIIVGLPAQHVAESATPAGPPGSPAPNQKVAAAVSEGSQLAFTVPATVTTLPLNLETLLAWAALNPVPPGQPAGVAAPPSENGSILELPYRMLLAVDSAQWQHSVAAVLDPATGTAELWRTTAEAPELHVAWSRDLNSPGVHPPGAPVPQLPPVQDPLAALRSRIAEQAPKLTVDRLTLSALGATTSLHAGALTITQPDGSTLPVTDWHHITSVGRDSYVRTLQLGYLAPFGHQAAIVTETERIPVTATLAGGTPAPYEELVSTSHIVILSSMVDYTEPVATAAYAALHPSMSVPLRKVQLPDHAGPLPVDPRLATKGGQVQDGGQPFLFRAVAEDLSGVPVELSLPMAFVPDTARDAAAALYQGLPAAQLGGQSVAFVGVPGPVAAAVDRLDGTVLPVETMSFALFTPTADSRLPFLPKLDQAAVRVLSASAVAGGAAALWTIGYHDDYLAKGIDAAANPGTVFAKVTGSDGVAGSHLLGLAAQAAGGLAAPQLNIDGLSRALGPVSGATDLIKGTFNPAALLSSLEQATFLGGIKLSDILAPIGAAAGGAAFDPAKVPAFLRSQLPQAIQTTFTWTPDLHVGKVQLGTDSVNVTIDTSKAALSLTVTVTAPLDGSLPTSQVHGRLTGVTFDFFDAVLLDVGLIEFTARSGHKVNLTTGHVKVTFSEKLAFLNELEQLLPPDGFADGVHIDADANGVTAGYSLAIPSVGIGIISIENIAFAAALSLPFSAPLGLRLDFSTREHPFLVSVAFIGGGGYFCLDVGTDGVHRIEGSLELGANLSVDLAIVSAEVHVMAGFYFGWDKATGATFSGFLRIGGSVNLLGLISVSVELYLALSYTSGTSGTSEISGTASLTLSVHVLFITKSVTLSVEKHFPVPGSVTHAAISPQALADQGGPLTPGPVSFSDLISPQAWDLYLGAFA